MSNDARIFLERLKAHQDSIGDEVGADAVGLGLLTALKEFDYYHYNLVRSERSEETDLHFHLLRLGLPSIVTEILSRVPKFRVPTATFRSDRNMILAALDATAGLGMIELGRRLAHAVLAGECQIIVTGEEAFEFDVPATMFALEHHEQEIEAHHRAQFSQALRDPKSAIYSEDTEQRISDLLDTHVFVWRKHFIGYGGDPELDDYFFGLAYLATMNESGFDDFHYSLQFGGVPFQKYTLAAACSPSRPLRQTAAFC